MLLGDLIARLDDPAAAAETLVSLGDLTLLTTARAAAAEQRLDVGEFTARAIDRFMAQASDEDWLTLLGVIARAPDPAGAFLRRVLTAALKEPSRLSPAEPETSSPG